MSLILHAKRGMHISGTFAKILDTALLLASILPLWQTLDNLSEDINKHYLATLHLFIKEVFLHTSETCRIH